MRNKIFLLSLFLLCACAENNSPRPVAEKFITAFQKRDFDEASKYTTKETAKLLQQLKRIEELSGEKEPVSEAKITVTSEEIAGNKATVFFTEEGSSLEEKITLEKVLVDPDSKEREWKVSLTKTDVKIPKPFNGPALPDSSTTNTF